MAIIDSDPVKTRANVIRISTDVSNSGTYPSRNTSHGKYKFKGTVEVDYSYEFEGKTYIFNDDFDYLYFLDIIEKQGRKEVSIGLDDIQYLSVKHSRKYPAIHMLR